MSSTKTGLGNNFKMEDFREEFRLYKERQALKEQAEKTPPVVEEEIVEYKEPVVNKKTREYKEPKIHSEFGEYREYRDYMIDKRDVKASAINFVWILLIFVVLFIFTMVRFAFTSDNTSDYRRLPSADAVFGVAQKFVLPTIRDHDVKFSEDGYQFGQVRDSVFVIRSFVEGTGINGRTHKTNFKITLRFKGGSAAVKEDWEMIDLNEY